MFQEASVWELRLGKVASIVFTGLFSFLVFSNLEDFAEDEWWHLAFDYSAYTAGFLRIHRVSEFSIPQYLSIGFSSRIRRQKPNIIRSHC